MAELPTVTCAQVAAEMLWRLEHPEEFERLRVRTGLKQLDYSVNPLRGELVLIGAENGAGKSTFVNTLCLEAAKSSKRVLLFSLEDSKVELQARMLGLTAQLPPCQVLRNTVSKDQIARAKERVLAYRDMPFRIARNERDFGDILDTIGALAEADGLDVVVVDYLQALDGFSGSQDRRNQVREMVQGLQKVAREHEVLLVLVSQVVRPDSRKVGEEPTRHWLKEASDIADAADKILILWRDQSGAHAPTHIKCDKDKSGLASGWRARLDFDATCGAFVEAPGGVRSVR